MAKFALVTFVCILLVVESYALLSGITAKKGQFPYTVSLLRLYNHICDGAIIRFNFVVTTASCVSESEYEGHYKGVNLGLLQVHLGSNHFRQDGETAVVERINLHDNYDGTNNNIALLQLRKYFQFSPTLKAIPLQTTELEAGAKVTVSGWGGKGYDHGIPYLKYSNKFTSISNSECSTKVTQQLTDATLCLAHASGSGGCITDHGSPAVANNKLVGIFFKNYVSSCSFNEPDMIIKVSYYADWIMKVTGLPD